MSLQLNETHFGYTFNYWKVLRVNMLTHTPVSTCEVMIGLFKDEASKTRGDAWIAVRKYLFVESAYAVGEYPFRISELKTVDKTPRSISYGLLKTMTKDFVDATLKDPEASELVWAGAVDV